jgi:hypothetical protein
MSGQSQRQATLTLDSVVVAAPDQVSSDLADEVVILNLANGVYYGLDPVGADVWNFIQQPQRIAAVRDYVVSQYDVEPARCEQDILALLQDLAANNLIQVQPAS